MLYVLLALALVVLVGSLVVLFLIVHYVGYVLHYVLHALSVSHEHRWPISGKHHAPEQITGGKAHDL